MAGKKVANGVTPKPPAKRKKRTSPVEKKPKQQVALGTKPKPPKKRTRRG